MSELWQSTGVNQDPSLATDYPFVAPSDDLRYIFGDMFLAYDDDSCSFELPLSVTFLSGFDQALPSRRDITISDVNGNVVFDSSAASYSSSFFGSVLEVMEWIGDSGVLRATRHTYPPQYAAGVTYASSFTPVNGILSSRAVMKLPQRVRSIRVGLVKLTGSVTLVEGYNVNLTSSSPALVDGGRYTKKITIRANPGDGVGRYPGCADAVPAIFTINTISPASNGNFTWDASGCYRLQRPVELTTTDPRKVVLTDAHALTMYNDCSPCCTDDDFVKVYRGLTNLWNKYQALGVTAEAIRDQFTANIARWEAQRTCRLAQPLKLVFNAEPYCNLFIAGLMCNMTSCCIKPLVLRLTMQLLPDRGNDINLRCRETIRNGSDTNYNDTPYLPSGVFPILDTNFDYVDTQATSKFRTRLSLDGCNAGDSLSITLSAHAPDVYDASGQLCSQADPATVAATLPSNVLSLWATSPPPYPVRAALTRIAPISPTAGCGSCV